MVTIWDKYLRVLWQMFDDVSRSFLKNFEDMCRLLLEISIRVY